MNTISQKKNTFHSPPADSAPSVWREMRGGFGADARFAEPVDRAEKAGDEGCGGAEVDVLGRAELLDLAGVHDGEPVGEREGFLLIVGDEEEGDAGLALHGFELGAHLLAEFGVEGGEGLVEEEQAGFEDEGAGERDALLFAAGELGGEAVAFGGELDEVEGAEGAGLGVFDAAFAEAEFDVAKGGEVREEGVVLEDGADVALPGFEGVDGCAVE